MCRACFSSPVEFMNGKRREFPVTPPERELQWCYYSSSIFLASSQTATRPLSSFDTHPRWQPVTHSARSRRSYGKIGDCELSIVTPRELSNRNMHTGTKKRPTKSNIESVNKVISEVIHGFSELTMPSAQAKIRLVSYERSQFNSKNWKWKKVWGTSRRKLERTYQSPRLRRKG